MAWTNVFLVPGITVVVRKAGSTYSLLTSPFAGSAAVQGVDYNVDGAGIITIPAWTTNTLAFMFTDSGGSLAAAPEFPAIDMRGNFDMTALPPAAGFGFTYINEAIRGSTQVSSGQGATNHTITGTAYAGGDLIIGIYNDGSITSQDATGAVFGLELDVTIVPPPPSYFWTDNLNCTEYLPA